MNFIKMMKQSQSSSSMKHSCQASFHRQPWGAPWCSLALSTVLVWYCTISNMWILIINIEMNSPCLSTQLAPLSYHYLYNKWPHFVLFISFLLHCIVCWEAATVGSQMFTVCSASFAQLSLVHAGGWCAMFHPAPACWMCVFFCFSGDRNPHQLLTEGQHPSSHLKDVRSINNKSRFHSSRKQCQASSWTSCWLSDHF